MHQVEVNQDLYLSAERVGSISGRSASDQIEHWARVGRACLDNPDLPASFVEQSLISLNESRDETTKFEPKSAI